MFRMAFPKLITAEQYVRNGKPQGDPKFSMTMIFDEASLVKFQATDPNDANKLIDVDVRKVAAELAKLEWGNDLNLQEAFAKTWPVVDGNKYNAEQVAKGKKGGGDAYKDHKFIVTKASNEYPPRLRAQKDGKIVELSRHIDADMAIAKACFVGGYYAMAEVNVQPNEVDGDKYVNFYMNGVRFIKQGDRLGGQSMMEKFGGTVGGASDHNPTEGLDAGGKANDEIPF